MSDQAYTIDGEHETTSGWLYTFSMQHADGGQSDHELTLSWVDHEHLVGGAIAPERVAAAGFELAVVHFGNKLPERFDVSSLRRRIDRFDDRLRAQIDSPL